MFRLAMWATAIFLSKRDSRVGTIRTSVSPLPVQRGRQPSRPVVPLPVAPTSYGPRRSSRAVTIGTSDSHLSALTRSSAEFIHRITLRTAYRAGGYLGAGETAWLLAKIGKTLRIGSDDIVVPYALVVNGHDGATPSPSA